MIVALEEPRGRVSTRSVACAIIDVSPPADPSAEERKTRRNAEANGTRRWKSCCVGSAPLVYDAVDDAVTRAVWRGLLFFMFIRRPNPTPVWYIRRNVGCGASLRAHFAFGLGRFVSLTRGSK